MSEKKKPLEFPEEMQELSMELTLDGYENSIKFLYGKWVCIVEGRIDDNVSSL